MWLTGDVAWGVFQYGVLFIKYHSVCLQKHSCIVGSCIFFVVGWNYVTLRNRSEQRIFYSSVLFIYNVFLITLFPRFNLLVWPFLFTNSNPNKTSSSPSFLCIWLNISSGILQNCYSYRNSDSSSGEYLSPNSCLSLFGYHPIWNLFETSGQLSLINIRGN